MYAANWVRSPDLYVGVGKLSLHTSQVAHQARVYPGFHSMK